MSPCMSKTEELRYEPSVSRQIAAHIMIDWTSFLKLTGRACYGTKNKTKRDWASLTSSPLVGPVRIHRSTARSVL